MTKYSMHYMERLEREQLAESHRKSTRLMIGLVAFTLVALAVKYFTIGPA